MRVTADMEPAAGTFVDFKVLDQALEALLEPLDHAMVLCEQDPLLDLLRSFSFRTVALNVEPTTEALASYVFHGLWADRVLLGATVVSVTVYETDKYSATVTDTRLGVYRVPERP